MDNFSDTVFIFSTIKFCENFTRMENIIYRLIPAVFFMYLKPILSSHMPSFSINKNNNKIIQIYTLNSFHMK